jgi:5-methyltetrahydrofolate--homocysteine methyltransferase
LRRKSLAGLDGIGKRELGGFMTTPKYYESMSEGNANRIKEMTQEALARGEGAASVLEELIESLNIIGVGFRDGEIYLPEMMIAARAMHAGLGVLRPVLAKSAGAKAAKVVLGTVQGDLHDIGKNLVGMMLEGGGFEVIDLGIDVPSERFIETAREQGAQVIALSALLTTTMVQMQEAVRMIRAEGLNAKVVVGGAPVTAAFAKEIGADGYAEDAASAVSMVKEVLKGG